MPAIVANGSSDEDEVDESEDDLKDEHDGEGHSEVVESSNAFGASKKHEVADEVGSDHEAVPSHRETHVVRVILVLKFKLCLFRDLAVEEVVSIQDSRVADVVENEGVQDGAEASHEGKGLGKLLLGASWLNVFAVHLSVSGFDSRSNGDCRC